MVSEDKKSTILRMIATGTPTAKALLLECDSIEEEEELNADKSFVRRMERAKAQYSEALRANITFCMDKNIRTGGSTEARYLHTHVSSSDEAGDIRAPTINDLRSFGVSRDDDNVEMGG